LPLCEQGRNACRTCVGKAEVAAYRAAQWVRFQDSTRSGVHADDLVVRRVDREQLRAVAADLQRSDAWSNSDGFYQLTAVDIEHVDIRRAITHVHPRLDRIGAQRYGFMIDNLIAGIARADPERNSYRYAPRDGRSGCTPERDRCGIQSVGRQSRRIRGQLKLL